jgi:hypothetical protein
MNCMKCEQRPELWLLVFALMLFACRDESVGMNSDAGGADAATTCGTEPLEMWFELSTLANAEQISPGLWEYLAGGEATYHGEPTYPVDGDPEYVTELLLEGDYGEVDVLHYRFPMVLVLPVELHEWYRVVYRIRESDLGETRGIVLEANVPGENTRLLIADTGTFGRAFEAEDSAMSPFKVHQVEDPNCPTTPSPECGSTLYWDALLLDSTSGDGGSQIQLHQGQSGGLSMWGLEYRVINLSSTRVEPPCPGSFGERISYLAVLGNGG